MMFFDKAAIESLPLQYAVRIEMDMAGLEYYKAKRIKKLPWLVGIAKDFNTPGCMTVREVKGNRDIAVYSCLSLKEVIDSFVNDDSVAAVNCTYFDNFKDAAAYLRSV